MPASKNVSLWYMFLYTFHCWDSVVVFRCLLGVLVYRKFPFWKRLTEIDYLSHNMWKLVLAKPGHTTLKIVYLITWLIWGFTYLSRPMTKPTKWHVRPAKTRIILGIRPVWSESSLSAWRKLGSLATHWAQAKTLMRLGRSPGWSESLLGAHAILF